MNSIPQTAIHVVSQNNIISINDLMYADQNES